MGFPGGSVVKIEQCKGHQLDPWYGKMPHATEQLNPWVTAPETVLESPRAATTLRYLAYVSTKYLFIEQISEQMFSLLACKFHVVPCVLQYS